MTQVQPRFAVDGQPSSHYGPRLYANRTPAEMAQGQGEKVYTLVMDHRTFGGVLGNASDGSALLLPEGASIISATLHTTETYSDPTLDYNIGYRSADFVDFVGDAFFLEALGGELGDFQDANGSEFTGGGVVSTTNGVGIVISTGNPNGLLGTAGTIYLEITYRTADDRAQNP